MTTDIAQARATSAALYADRREAEFGRFRKICLDLWGGLIDGNRHQVAKSLEVIEAMPSYTVEDLETAISDASRPMSNEGIVQQLTLLIAAFPNAPARADLTAFGTLLVDDVIVLAPSVFAAETACRKLRQTEKFLPSIADVIQAITKADSELRQHRFDIKRFPSTVEQARMLLANERGA